MKNTAKRRKIVVGNWKLNPQTLEEARKIFTGIKKSLEKIKNVEVVVCPPFSFIHPLAKASGALLLGSQNVFWENNGAFTGEVSADMLKSIGCSATIIGHSERRAMGESNEMVSKKVVAAAMAGLRAIVCVGEKVRDQNGEYLGFLKNQIKESLDKLPKRALTNIVIAYEPIWAIGKSYNTAMSGTDMHEISIFIKKVLADMYGAQETAKISILYGGSVAPSNAKDIIETGHVDGFLVGRQSLEPGSFAEIVKIVSVA